VRTSLFLVLVLSALRIGSAAETSQDQAFSNLVERASAAQRRGDFKIAAQLYEQSLAMRTGVPELRVNLGLMLHLLGDYRAALNHFRQALKEDSTLFAANLFAGIDLLKLRQYSDASTFLKRAYKLNGSDFTVNLSLGQLHADLGEYETANQFYFQASELDSRRSEAWYGLAVTYLNVQRTAIETLSEREGGADHIDEVARTDFSKAAADRERFVEAVQSATSQRADASELSNLAILSGALAQQAIVKVLEIDPSSSAVHALLGNAYSELHDYSKAQEEFKKALARDPQDLSAHLGLATLYAREHQPEQAAAELRIIFKARPRDPEAAYLQGRLLVDAEKFDQAIPYLETALAGTVSNVPHVHALLGKVYAAQGKTAKAIAEYRQSLGADRQGGYHYRLYRLYLTAGDKEKSNEMLQQVRARRRNHQ